MVVRRGPRACRLACACTASVGHVGVRKVARAATSLSRCYFSVNGSALCLSHGLIVRGPSEKPGVHGGSGRDRVYGPGPGLCTTCRSPVFPGPRREGHGRGQGPADPGLGAPCGRRLSVEKKLYWDAASDFHIPRAAVMDCVAEELRMPAVGPDGEVSVAAWRTERAPRWCSEVPAGAQAVHLSLPLSLLRFSNRFLLPFLLSGLRPGESPLGGRCDTAALRAPALGPVGAQGAAGAGHQARSTAGPQARFGSEGASVKVGPRHHLGVRAWEWGPSVQQTYGGPPHRRTLQSRLAAGCHCTCEDRL